MKKVIIIEDNETDFKNIQSTFYSDFPNGAQNAKKWNMWKKHLENAMIPNSTEKGEPEKSKLWLTKKIKSFYTDEDEVVFLVDFFLKGEKWDENVNGINFCKLILHKELFPDKHIPICFITNASGNDNNKVSNYVQQINDTTLCISLNKFENYWKDDGFINKIKEFINNAKSKPRTSDEQTDTLKQSIQNIMSMPYSVDVRDDSNKVAFENNLNWAFANNSSLTNIQKNAIENFRLKSKTNICNFNELFTNGRTE
jgi:hypothetical protein